MISVYQLKSRFQSLLRPLVKKLNDYSVTANQITLAACFGSLFVTFIVIFILPHTWILWLIPIWMFVRMALNAIDGMLAKEFAQKSNLGAYLNELCDVISDSSLFIILFYLPDASWILVLLLIIGAFLTEYAGVLGVLVGGSRRYDGPMGKSDRALLFGIISACLALGWLPATALNIVLSIILILLILTIINRVKTGLCETLH
ncbi:CDP-alcohol phosphatidyltransferase family protein [Orbus sturtevantii]|uniref:CDP-alcohol phosphatidyltransferase family protein n=1 Tax=Orbus sturtevantii TaxID=3074109 RepID=UPI00370D55FA